MALSDEEKRKIIEALEEDKEFRYTLMGLLDFREILDRITRLEERYQKIDERLARLEERQYRLEEEMKKTRRVLITIAHRFGLLSEAEFREAMKYVVEEVFGTALVEKKSLRDAEGIVYGHEAVIDIDVLIRDREHIIIEVKSKVSRGDIVELHRIGKLYEKTYKIKPRLVIIEGFIEPKAWETANKLGVEIKPAIKTD